MGNDVKTIMCVDDDCAVLDVLKLTLEAGGAYKIKGFDNGRAALLALENFVPDAFLLDMNMPEMDGKQLLAQLKQIPLANNIPIGFLTAEVSSEKLKEYISIGACGVIAKPIDIEALTYQVAILFGNSVAA